MQKSLILRSRVGWVLGMVFIACGNSQPRPITVPTPTGTVSDVDGNVYPTIVIGRQEWMVENLKTTQYSDSTPIALVTDASTWANLTSAAYCWYDNDPTNKDNYGAMYNWYVVQTGKLCPLGWGVPSSDNWGVLANNLGGKAVAGGKLKEPGADWQSPNSGATNESGFSAVPGGCRDMNGTFIERGQRDAWWCSDEDTFAIPPASWFWDVVYSNAGSAGATSPWVFGYAIRCMRSVN